MSDPTHCESPFFAPRVRALTGNSLKLRKIHAGKWNHFRRPYGLILAAISHCDCQKMYIYPVPQNARFVTMAVNSLDSQQGIASWAKMRVRGMGFF